MPLSASSSMHSASLKRSSTRLALTLGPGELEPLGEPGSASFSGIAPTLAFCRPTKPLLVAYSRAPRATAEPMGATPRPGATTLALRLAGSGCGSAGRDDYQAHDLCLGSFRGHRQHDPPAPRVDVVGAGRDRGIDGAYPVFERAVEAGVAVDVDRGCAGGLGVRPADADEDAGSLVRPEPGACRIRRLADWGRRVRRAARGGAAMFECHHLIAGGFHRRRRDRRRPV